MQISLLHPYRRLAALCAFCLIASSVLYAQNQASNVILEGTIENPDGQPISGASLRIVGSNQGTYSDVRGRFRLGSPAKQATVRVSSLGYATQEIVLLADTLTRITLQPLPVRLQSVEVRADISAEEIIRKAIQRKRENLRSLNSIARRVYTKMSFATSVKVILAKPVTESFLTETVSQVYESFAPKRTTHTVVLQRRQTANFPAQANIASVSEIVNFLEDEIVIGSARLRSPLASSALDFYDYTLAERKAYSGKGARTDNSTVYVVQFKPKSRSFPGFEGTLSLLEGSFAPVSADFTPSESTVLPVLENVRYTQTFEPFGDSAHAVWIPTYLQLTAGFTTELGLLRAGGQVSLQSIVSNVEVLQSLPDNVSKPSATISVQKIQRKSSTSTPRTAKLSDSVYITLAPSVDSVDTQFWKTAALLEYTPKEDSLYHATDSIAKHLIARGRRTTTQIFDSTITVVEEALAAQQSSVPYLTPSSLFRFPLGTSATIGFSPILMQPRVTRRVYGVETALDWRQSSVRLEAMASEQWQWFGSVRLIQRLLNSEEGGVALIGDVFSRVRSIQPQRFGRLGWAGLSTDYGLFEQHFDFFREDGVSAGVKGVLGSLEGSLAGQWARQFSMASRNDTRSNIPIANGDFRTARAEVAWNPNAANGPFGFAASDTTTFSIRLSGMLSEEASQNLRFHKLEATATFIQPTFFTGYSPMYLALFALAGLASENTPAQERFILFRRYSYVGAAADFLTPGISAVGGTRTLSLRAEHNFSDLAWRAIGLPTHKGRGLEFILHGDAALFEQDTAPQAENSPRPSEGWYSELGFGIGRIPVFVIDFLMLRFDAAWSVGGREPGRFGWSVGVNFSL
jgi:hypothetical protein